MLLGFAELLILGFVVEWVCRRCSLPGLVGMLALGLLVGVSGFNCVSSKVLSSSSDLRLLALVIILLRAGLQVERRVLPQIGYRSLMLAILPGLCEGLSIAFLASYWLPLSGLEAAMLGFIIAAVSPAVIVPQMIELQENNRGMKKGIPTMVLLAASLDDVVAIMIFSVLLGIYSADQSGVMQVISAAPIYVIGGIVVGIVCGYGFIHLCKRCNPRATKRVLVLIAVSLLLIRVESIFSGGSTQYGALIAILVMGAFILLRQAEYAHEIGRKLSKVWILAALFLFVIMGAQVDISLAGQVGWRGVGIILCGLLVRSAIVYGTLLGSALNYRERLFVVISFWPKATVQAAVGAAPLMLLAAQGRDLFAGELILAMAFLSILITAPLGAISINWAADRCLN